MSQSQQRVLFIFTSAALDRNNKPIGWFLPDAAYPYHVLKKDFQIDFAAPKGPNPPMDPYNITEFKDDEVNQQFLKESTTGNLLEKVKRLDSINWEDYQAILYIGGRGTVMDLPENDSNTKLANDFYRSGRLFCAISHGPAALVEVKDKDGNSIFHERKVTALSNAEEKLVGTGRDGLPFNIETRIGELHGEYVKSDKPWTPKVVRTGNLLTAQNPQSAEALAEEMKKALQSNVRAD